MVAGLSVAAIVLGVVALVFAAYNVVMIRQMRGLEARVEELEARLEPEEEEEEEPEEEEEEEEVPEEDIPVEPEPPAPPKGQAPPVWQAFIDSFNKISPTLAGGKDAAGATGFVKDNKLQMLVCTGHSTNEEGNNMPTFASEEKVESSMYWAFPIPGRPLDYAVVPNPMLPYDKVMHTEKGMKETFASNYKEGSMPNIAVKIPALCHKKGETWEIAQPGVLQLS